MPETPEPLFVSYAVTKAYSRAICQMTIGCWPPIRTPEDIEKLRIYLQGMYSGERSVTLLFFRRLEQ